VRVAVGRGIGKHHVPNRCSSARCGKYHRLAEVRRIFFHLCINVLYYFDALSSASDTSGAERRCGDPHRSRAVSAVDRGSAEACHHLVKAAERARKGAAPPAW
jgi:hypothetical protein